MKKSNLFCILSIFILASICVFQSFKKKDIYIAFDDIAGYHYRFIDSTDILKTSKILITQSGTLSYQRWEIDIDSSKITKTDIAASTGIHDGKAAIKQILAGAASVQVCSTLYKNGLDQLDVILKDIEKWMENKGYKSIEEFRGKLSYANIESPALYERVQFMKYFSNYK